jgi:hypothetical protein
MASIQSHGRDSSKTMTKSAEGLNYPQCDDASNARLAEVLEDVEVRSSKDLYDFGDSWEHSVASGSLLPRCPGVTYPRLIEAVGRCPSQDVGGPCREFLKAITHPNHEVHGESSQWVGDGFREAAGSPADTAFSVLRPFGYAWWASVSETVGTLYPLISCSESMNPQDLLETTSRASRIGDDQLDLLILPRRSISNLAISTSGTYAIR